VRKRFMATRPGGAGALDWGWGPGEERDRGYSEERGSEVDDPEGSAARESSEASGWLWRREFLRPPE